MTAFVGGLQPETPLAPLGQARSVLRVRIRRTGFFGSFYEKVNRFLNEFRSPSVSVLTGRLPELKDSDDVAVVDLRVKADPGSGTAGEVVREIERAGFPVEEIRAMGPVPGFSQGGPAALEGTRSTQQRSAQAAAEAVGSGVSRFVSDLFKGIGTGSLSVFIIAALLLFALLYARKKGAL